MSDALLSPIPGGTIDKILKERAERERQERIDTAVESRWGFHPVNREDFQILKDLHKFFWETWRQAYARMRWGNKLPHNRVRFRKIRNEKGQVIGRSPDRNIPEPQWDDRVIDFSKSSSFRVVNPNNRPGEKDHKWYEWTWRTHHVTFTHILRSRRPVWNAEECRTVYEGLDIVEDFRKARMPVDKPENIELIDMPLYRALHARLFS